VAADFLYSRPIEALHGSRMRQALVSLLFLAALLWGCASQSVDQVSDDTVQIIPSGGGADFLVLFLNRWSLLFNGDLPADRQRIIASRLKSTGCRDPRMLRERAEDQQGSWSFGRKRVVYYSEWKCG
jgi:hypothetical protein